MIELLVTFLWLLVKLVVIWGAAYILRLLIDWAPIIPVPVKTALWYLVAIVAFIFSVIVIIGFIQGAPWPAFGLLGVA